MKTKFKNTVLKSIFMVALGASIPFITVSCNEDVETSKSDQTADVLPQQLKVGDRIVVTFEDSESTLLILSETRVMLINKYEDEDEELTFNYIYTESGDTYIMTIQIPITTSSFVTLANEALDNAASPLSQAVKNLSDPATSKEIVALENALDDIHPDWLVDYDVNNDFYLEKEFRFGFPKSGVGSFSYTIIGDYLVFGEDGKIVLDVDAFEETDTTQGTIKYIPASN